ncbi:MAG: glucose-6-phosphate isomerase [Alphaproteobacteria bacterium]|nr:glucose-6-phosphate isomerase [Alphaproteobacteria bacterium]
MTKSILKNSILFCFEPSIGQNGLSEKTFNTTLLHGEKFLKKWQNQKDFPLFRSTHEDLFSNDLQHAQEKLSKFEEILVLGTGGSSLGGQTLQALSKNDKRNLVFLDNIDPFTIEKAYQRDWSKTGIIVISKSGETAETLLQFLIALKSMRKDLSDLKISDHLVVLTEPKPSSLSKLADYFNCPILPHDQNIGGRYAVLSNVGLLPAILMGLDVSQLQKGAQDTLDDFMKADHLHDIPSLTGAALHYAFLEKGINQTVFMPYIDRCERLSAWHSQLWAESLGKNNKGLTPIRSIGAVDQHSQLQLFLDGPKNKFFTLLCAEQKGLGAKPDQNLGFTENLKSLSKHSLGNLMEAEQKATYETLAQNGCPVRLISFDSYNEEVLGSLLMHFMLETILMAEYLDVNAFDQPAVEQGKILAQHYLKQNENIAA